MDILHDIDKIMGGDTTVATREWLDEALEHYPYFALPALLYLKQHGIEGDDNRAILDRLALVTPDRQALAMQLGVSAQLFASFYPEPLQQQATPGTDEAIDQFLNTFGSTSSKEIEAINNAIFNPTPDYADVLAAQERDEGGTADATDLDMSHDDELINKFIAQEREREKRQSLSVPQQHVEPAAAAEIAHTPIAEPKPQDDSMLSESLAKMYISRGKYSKALEIIENINLKFPEKSIYFADQIRFLRKLVLNEKSKK
jgi:hypothetical protein